MPIDKDGFLSLEIDDILDAENDCSQWRDRYRIWISKIDD